MFLLKLFGFCVLLCLPIHISTASTNSTPSKSAPKATAKNPAPSRRQNVEASSRSSEKMVNYKAQTDFQNIVNQHLLGPVNNNPMMASSKEERPKGKLQTIGSVLGDIIGVLISEVSRFFGGVISDVAREVTAHGFVNVLRQFAEITGLGSHASRSQNQPVNNHLG